MNQKHKRLVILSIPFTRIVRVLLCQPVLRLLRQHCDVVIVSPFAGTPTFRSEFGVNGTRLLQWQLPEKPRQPLGALLAISELLRSRGYWRRFRNHGLAHLSAFSSCKYGEDGNDQQRPLIVRVGVFFISIVGMWAGAWRLLDRLIGPSLFNFQELEEIAEEYEQVTLIQSASWGNQDRMLAWLGRQRKWRTILVPYTSDQVYCNGFLMSDFDAVCVQGPFEEQCAKTLQDVPVSRIVRLGSVWFRHMGVLVADLNNTTAPGRAGRRRTILFAGVSNIYFPRASERMALEALLRAIDDGRLSDVDLVYRPGVTDQAAKRKEIEDLWAHRPGLRIQWPQTSCVGLDQYGDGRVDAELREYVSQIGEANIVVMSLVTSLCMDAAFLGIPSISVFADSSGTLDRRKSRPKLDADAWIYGFRGVPIAHELDALVPLVQRLLERKDESKELASQLAGEWDYPAVNFQKTLIEAVTG